MAIITASGDKNIVGIDGGVGVDGEGWSGKVRLQVFAGHGPVRVFLTLEEALALSAELSTQILEASYYQRVK